jgi:hypothetical protein
MTPRVRLRVVLPAVLLGLLAWAAGRAYLHYFEPVIDATWKGRSRAALEDPLLAAEQFLTAMGYPARPLGARFVLPATSHVLVFLHRTTPFAKLRSKEILAWVARGGHLVVTPLEGSSLDGKADERPPDPVLAALGVAVAPDSPTDRLAENLVLPLAPIKSHGLLAVPKGPRLLDTRQRATERLGQVGKTFFLLVVPYGRGAVTVVSDLSGFDNSEIGSNDNAALVLWLAAGVVHPAGVELSWRDEMPSLGALAAEEGWMVLVSVLFLGAALAWRAAARFGPLLPEPPAERRSLLEHIEASGRWLWRNDRGVERRLLIDAVRRAVRRRVEARRPAWSRLSGAQLIEHLAATAGLAPQEVAEALHGAAITDEAHFLATVSALTEVRRSL